MKHLHFFPLEKFTANYIRIINTNFNPDDHLFITYGSYEIDKIEVCKGNNISYIPSFYKAIPYIEKKLFSAEKVFLHYLGIWPGWFIAFLSFQPWMWGKYHWVIWGSDLYYHEKKKVGFKEKCYEHLRAILIRHLHGIIFFIEGEYELAKRWYGTRAKYYDAGYYVDSNKKVVEALLLKMKPKTESDDRVHVLLGNSAAPSNLHIEAIEVLAALNIPNIVIHCPLSYGGNEDYIQQVINCGKTHFGDRFDPILDFMTFEDYVEFLSQIDIGVFNFKRQQGMGNINTLLILGKKVYINDDITPWEYFEKHGIMVSAFNRISAEDFLVPLNREVAQNNRNIFRMLREPQRVVTQWRTVFDDK